MRQRQIRCISQQRCRVCYLLAKSSSLPVVAVRHVQTRNTRTSARYSLRDDTQGLDDLNSWVNFLEVRLVRSIG